MTPALAPTPTWVALTRGSNSSSSSTSCRSRWSLIMTNLHEVEACILVSVADPNIDPGQGGPARPLSVDLPARENDPFDAVKREGEGQRRPEQHRDDLRRERGHQNAAGRERRDNGHVRKAGEQHHRCRPRPPQITALAQHIDARLTGQDEHQERQCPHLAGAEAKDEPAGGEYPEAIAELEDGQRDGGARH